MPGTGPEPEREEDELEGFWGAIRDEQQRLEENPREDWPVEYSVALFCSTYPGLFFDEGWPTDDGNVPWKLFWVLLGRAQNVMALGTLRQTQAVGQGIALAFGGDDGGVQEGLRKLTEQAQGG